MVGANEVGFHLVGVNWGRDLPEPEVVADIRNVIEGDRAVDGGKICIARGIEVGHVFQLGRKYAEAMKATVLDEYGKARHHDDGLLWHRCVTDRCCRNRTEP